MTRRERLAALACVLLALAALCVGCSARVIPDEEVAERRAKCLKNGGFFQRYFNTDGTVNRTACRSVESNK